MEQMEISIKTEAEAAATSPAHCDSEVGVNFIKQEPGLLQSVKSEPSFTNDAELKEEILLDGSPDGSEQQCVHGLSTPARTGGVDETCSTSLGDLLNVKYESAEMDIEPTVLQHKDTHYTIHKNMSAAADENAVLVNCNEAIPGGGIKKENVEGEWRDNKATSHTYNQRTTEVDYDEAHVYFHPEQQKDLQKHLLHQHRACEKGCSSEADLNLHKRSHSSVELTDHLVNNESETRRKHYNCDSGANFAQSGDLTKTMGVHTLCRCKICDGRFANNFSLTRHMSVYTGEKSYQCKICDARFAQNIILTQHVKVHKDERSYQCKICDARFVNRSGLTNHVRVHTGEKPYQCKICDARFTQNISLTRHMSVHTGEKSYQCKICDARFARNTSLTLHMSKKHGEKPYQCKLCDAMFTHKSHLIRHMSVHTGEKPYQCKICDAKFVNSSGLTTHVRVHTGEKPYQCKICDARFTQNISLTRHMSVHTGEKPYQCKICDARFAQSGCLTRHMSVHTGEKSYQCKICDARFTRNTSLTRHMSVHTGEKSYQCKLCDARFTHKSHLTRHMTVHTGEKPYH